MAKCGLCGDVDGDGILTINDAKLQWEFETGMIPISDLACPQYRLHSIDQKALNFTKLDNCYNGTQVPHSIYQVYKNSYLFDSVLELIDSQQVSAFPDIVQTPFGRYPNTKTYIDSINQKLDDIGNDIGNIDCCCKGGALWNNLVNAYNYMGFTRSGEPKALNDCCNRCKKGLVLNENDPCFDWCGCCENNNNISNTFNSQYNYLQLLKNKPVISETKWYTPGLFHAFKNMKLDGDNLVCSSLGNVWTAALIEDIDNDGMSPGLEAWQISNEKLMQSIGYPSVGRWVRFKYLDKSKGAVCRQYIGKVSTNDWEKMSSNNNENEYFIDLNNFESVFKNFETCDLCMDLDPEKTHNCERSFSWCDFYNNNKSLIDDLNCRNKCLSGELDPTDSCFKFCNCFYNVNKIMKIKL